MVCVINREAQQNDGVIVTFADDVLLSSRMPPGLLWVQAAAALGFGMGTDTWQH